LPSLFFLLSETGSYTCNPPASISQVLWLQMCTTMSGQPFIFLMALFKEQRLFILMKSSLPIFFSFMSCAFVVVLF
jgi:hypothetical protein